VQATEAGKYTLAGLPADRRWTIRAVACRAEDRDVHDHAVVELTPGEVRTVDLRLRP